MGYQREYRRQTNVPSVSKNVDTLTELGDAEMLAVKHLPLEVIPQFVQRFEDDLEGSPLAVGEESFDVLKEKILGSLSPCDSSEVKEQSASCILESTSSASNRESLARESTTEKVEVGKRVCCELGDVSIRGVGEVRLVNPRRVRVDFGEANAFVASFLEGDFETADAAEGGEVFRRGLGKEVYARRQLARLHEPAEVKKESAGAFLDRFRRASGRMGCPSWRDFRSQTHGKRMESFPKAQNCTEFLECHSAFSQTEEAATPFGITASGVPPVGLEPTT